ncbi:cyclic nucleotide-binding domain-containing protein [Cohnella lupini]|uniref:Methyl-accepting chemotaxis protein (MCP) signaling protein n=1 Tax=Cohnella lupini TaxID=1294267 RepID=A0A3D9HZV9_9BACL|nr:cyclic nucleotide-binding domain-containing protein [Cohnella lupini]RED54940.1 methyl-accepting chemotaxis protein (MCP) signaling protein [Cohnella lupini]
MTEAELTKSQGEQTEYRPGQTIFQEGDAGSHMYVLLEGSVEVYVQSAGVRIPVAKFAPGDFFGEMSLLEGLPRSGTAVAAERCLLASLDEESFRKRMAEDTAFAWRVMKALSSRIRNHNRELILKIGGDLQEVSAQLDDNAREIHQGIEDIASSANEIESNEKRLAGQVKDVQTLSERIVSTLGFLQQVARQTQILGLNAGIEASRSGEFGRGFLIIAEEIRKLSVQSRENAEQIALLTEQIGSKISSVAAASEDSSRRSNEQAVATNQMVVSIGKVAQLADRLAGLSRSLES